MTCAELADVVEGLRGQSRTPLGVRGSPSLQHPFGPNQIKRVTLPGWGPLAKICVCVFRLPDLLIISFSWLLSVSCVCCCRLLKC
eukprot:COSAG06_NODE_3480_length_5282_cov_28.899093_4_plen_85_part_00